MDSRRSVLQGLLLLALIGTGAWLLFLRDAVISGGHRGATSPGVRPDASPAGDSAPPAVAGPIATEKFEGSVLPDAAGAKPDALLVTGRVVDGRRRPVA